MDDENGERRFRGGRRPARRVDGYEIPKATLGRAPHALQQMVHDTAVHSVHVIVMYVVMDGPATDLGRWERE